MAFPGTGTIWMNGKLVEWNKATIHVASHVVHYGSGVFEGARCYATPKGSACFRLDEHLVRLVHSAKIYRMEYAGLDLAGWRDAVLQTIRANGMKACYIRPLVYRGYDTLGVNPLNNPVDAAIMVHPFGYDLAGDGCAQLGALQFLFERLDLAEARRQFHRGAAHGAVDVGERDFGVRERSFEFELLVARRIALGNESAEAFQLLL